MDDHLPHDTLARVVVARRVLGVRAAEVADAAAHPGWTRGKHYGWCVIAERDAAEESTEEAPESDESTEDDADSGDTATESGSTKVHPHKTSHPGKGHGKGGGHGKGHGKH